MGTKTWIFIGAVAIIVYQWYPITEHNILVLVKSNTFDISKLAQIKNLKAAFKIDKNIDEHMKRNNPSELEAKVFFQLINRKYCFFVLIISICETIQYYELAENCSFYF